MGKLTATCPKRLTPPALCVDDRLVRIKIQGRNLPGRRWISQGETYADVHVGVQERKIPVGLVAGDALSAVWQVDVRVTVDREGVFDFKGPAVHGQRGERFLYLTWGDVRPDGSFQMFRRAKLMLNRIDRDVVRHAEATERLLLATVELTDRCGGPRCARVDPPDLIWAVE